MRMKSSRIIGRLRTAHTALVAPASVMAGGIMFSIIAVAALTLDARNAHHEHLRQAELSLRSVTQSVEHHGSRTFEAIDLLLRLAAEQATDLGSPDLDPERIHAALAERAQASPMLSNLFVFDAGGDLTLESGHFPARGFNAADRPYFMALREGADDGLHVSAPFRSHLSGRTSFTASRRIQGRDGSFAGVVLASIDMGYFKSFYDGLELGFSGAAALFTDTGDLIFRHPHADGLAGTNHAGKRLFTEHLPMNPSGVYVARSAFDGRERLIAYHRIAGMPLVVSASYAMDDVLREWRRDALRSTVLAFLLATGSGLGTVAVARELRGRRRAEREAQDAEREARSALAEARRALDEASRLGRDLAAERDRSERARLAAESASRAKSSFLAMMSHELRTPLNAVIGFSDILRQEMFGPLGEPRYVEYANDINASGTHLLGLVTDILDLSRIEAGKADIDLRRVELAQLVASAARVALVPAAGAGIETRLDVPRLPIRAMVDERRLRQALINIVGNAVKFTGPGGRVSVAMTEEAAAGTVRIRVEDTGIGIPEAEIAHVFEPFWQGGGMLSRRHGGAGLGLAITRHLVQLQGGEIHIQSVAGRGTTVEIHLPCAAPA
jgi:signal transduction histidine kinase